MFSWSKKKDSKRRGRGENNDSEENEFGIKLDKGPSDKQLEAELKALAGVDAFPEDEMNLNEGEDDVELELLRLLGKKGKKQSAKPTNSDEPSGVDIMGDLTAEIDLGEEDVEVDENDPDLLGELMELTQPDDGVAVDDDEESESDPGTPANEDSDILSVLKERLKMYKTAEAKAKENKESSRARRFGRGIKTLEDLIKKAKAGKPVSPDDIPTAIAMNLKPAPPLQPKESDDLNSAENGMPDHNQVDNSPIQNQTSTQSEPEDVMQILYDRLKMYREAEMKAKEAGEMTRSRRFNRGIKTIEGLIKEAKAGKDIAPSEIPPVVALNLKPPPPLEQVESNTESPEGIEEEMGSVNLDGNEDDVMSSKESEEPERNIMDVLAERLKMYQTAEENAKEAGESTRARRFNRGIKTLHELIRKATAGQLIGSDDIPPPIALNLKPAPPIIETVEKEDPVELPVENVTLNKSSDDTPLSPLKFTIDDDEDVDLSEDEWEDEVPPTTVMEGLEQRLRIYNKLLDKAKNDGNEESVDQNEKIIRIYLNAIRTYKNGGYIDVLKLPAPKGCPPIPIPFHIP